MVVISGQVVRIEELEQTNQDHLTRMSEQAGLIEDLQQLVAGLTARVEALETAMGE